MYIDIVMLFKEEVSRMSKSGYSDMELLEYINEHYDEIECELNGEEGWEPKKRDHYFCMGCKLRTIEDYERSTLVFALNVEYLSTILFMCHHTIIRCNLQEGNAYTRDMIIMTLWKRLGLEYMMKLTYNLYNYIIPIMIPILECILKRKGLTMYKSSLYYIYFKLSGVPFPHINTKEYNTMLTVFDVVSTIYDKYKPKGQKSFLNYPFVLKQILIMMDMDQYAKYIPKLKTHSKQKELERVWELITKDPEWAVALRKRKIV